MRKRWHKFTFEKCSTNPVFSTLLKLIFDMVKGPHKLKFGTFWSSCVSHCKSNQKCVCLDQICDIEFRL